MDGVARDGVVRGGVDLAGAKNTGLTWMLHS